MTSKGSQLAKYLVNGNQPVTNRLANLGLKFLLPVVAGNLESFRPLL